VSKISKKEISAMLLAFYGTSSRRKQTLKPVRFRCCQKSQNPENIVGITRCCCAWLQHVLCCCCVLQLLKIEQVSDAAVAAAAIRAIPPEEPE
jgi:hypothetical protein